MLLNIDSYGSFAAFSEGFVLCHVTLGTVPNVKVVIEFSGTNVLENNAASVTASAKVYNEGVEVTNSIPASHFSWMRESGNATADAAWNGAHTGMKQVTVARSELTANTVISCTVQAVDFYGTVQVDDTLMASHTPSSSDANDTFSIVDGDLIVNTSKAAGCYIVDEGSVKANNVILIHDLTASAVVYTARPNKMMEFKYNADGLWTRKEMTLGSKVVTTDYTLHGKLVTHMKVRTELNGVEVDAQHMHFFYDAQSRPAMVEWNGRKYTYVHNLQGDIVAILDSEGTKVVEYRYDAWGRDIGRTLTSEIGRLNPFRYRGYMYDEETVLYYLRSRYYNAGIGRFICADNQIKTGQTTVGLNVYCYVNNNVVMSVDGDGTETDTIPFSDMHGTLVFLKKDIDFPVSAGEEEEESLLFTGHIASILNGHMLSYGPYKTEKKTKKKLGKIELFNSAEDVSNYMYTHGYEVCYYSELEMPNPDDIRKTCERLKSMRGKKISKNAYRVKGLFKYYSKKKSACIDFASLLGRLLNVDIDSRCITPSRYPRLMVIYNPRSFNKVISWDKGSNSATISR